MIKTLSNELCIPLVCAGMPAAANAIQRDEQLRSRFPPERLPLWELDADYMNLLQSFELLLPLKKPSNLTQESLAIKILALTEGTIGEISILLKEAAITAIESGKEHITSSILKSTGYVPPSKRG
ncbi:MAG: hypothetical protein EOO61_04260 [Hymenobacter sp.]|nr:MAG: hypothetical protein EOO61_04260 [Hymenobacter sp.]